MPQQVQTPPPQERNTDYSVNPIVIIKESLDWLRHHRKVTSTIVKLACATVGIVILLIVLSNGKSLLAFIVDKSSYLIAKVTGSSEGKVPERIVRTRVVPGAKTDSSANTSENSGNESATAPPPGGRSPTAPPPGGRSPTAALPPAPLIPLRQADPRRAICRMPHRRQTPRNSPPIKHQPRRPRSQP